MCLLSIEKVGVILCRALASKQLEKKFTRFFLLPLLLLLVLHWELHKYRNTNFFFSLYRWTLNWIERKKLCIIRWIWCAAAQHHSFFLFIKINLVSGRFGRFFDEKKSFLYETLTCSTPAVCRKVTCSSSLGVALKKCLNLQWIKFSLCGDSCNAQCSAGSLMRPRTDYYVRVQNSSEQKRV